MNQEKIIEVKVCNKCSSNFEITDKDLEFYEQISPKFNGEIFKIPTPTLCPECRQQRRLAFRNERKLYKRKCDATNKDIISIYSPDKNYKVYTNEYWWSDNWNPMDYGRDFNFEETFFNQLKELQIDIPRIVNNLVDVENVMYSNQCWHTKDSYLCFNVGYSEKCFYSNEIFYSKEIYDCLDVKNSEKCFYSFFLNKCFNVFYSENCENCSNIYFSFDCKGSNNLFLCSNLRNKNYCIRNKQYTEDEYNKEIQKIFNGKTSNILELDKELKNIKLKSIFNENNNINTENSIGDYLNEVNNCYKCFNVYKTQDCKYLIYGDGDQKDCYDMDYVAEVEHSYEGAMVAGYNHLFGFMVVHGTNNFYCDLCFDCNDIFGCVGLRNKQYCILNKQYPKEEYEELVPKIINYMTKTKEWGEFFPGTYSPFGYNETVALEYFPVIYNHENSPHPNPLPRGEGIERGTIKNNKFIPLPLGEVRGGQEVFNRSDYEAPFPKVEKIIPASKLPDSIKDIPDDILNWAIECEVTNKPFRIIKQELDIYRKYNLPIPRKHPDQRYLERTALKNPRKLYERNCDKCGVIIKTTYTPEREEIVYCQKCYNGEIY